MAYADRELFQDLPGKGSTLRFFPSSVQPKTFASGSGTIARGTALAYNTSTNKWVVFTNGGANGTGTLQGFLWPDDITLDGAGEVLGNVMLGGRVHIDDIPIVAGYNLAQLKTALQTGAREKGFIVEGLENFR
jgi:hypothetical protein